MLLALITFCFVASVTPGPNNMMLLSSGATYGLRRTIPHILGITAGCIVMVLVVGWSLGGFAEYLPQFYVALQVAASGYLLWLAWKIATSVGYDQGKIAGKPLGAMGAAAFQWVNPKAWAMVLGAVTSFARPEHILADVLLIAIVLLMVGLPSVTLWAAGGSLLRNILHRPVLLRSFNWAMAALLVASLVPGWLALASEVQSEASLPNSQKIAR